MKRIWVILILICALICKSHSQMKMPDPLARKLNDSAAALVMSFPLNEDRKVTLEKAIKLLNQASDIDTNYILPYLSKFTFQTVLKEYKGAILSGTEIIRLWPTRIDIRAQVGIFYEKIGDLKTAEKYYQESLSLYDKILDTLNTNNKNYKKFLVSKASELVYLHQEKRAYDIARQLDSAETDIGKKRMYKQFIKTTRKELVSNDGAMTVTWKSNGVTHEEKYNQF